MLKPKLLLLIALACFSTSVLAQLSVIAHESVAQEQIDSDFIKKVYLGKKSRWEDGSKIIPIMLTKGEGHASFLNQYVNKTPAQFNTFWKKMIFTGKGAPPKSFDSQEELVKFVMETQGAIAYIEGSPPEGVKVLQILE